MNRSLISVPQGMLTQPREIQALDGGQSMHAKKADAEHCTYLAVNFGRKAEIGHGKGYHREAG